EYRHLYGLTPERLSRAAPDAIVMHPGPMNRGVEIDSTVADLPDRSIITEQVEMGVAIRMACLDVLTRRARGLEGWACRRRAVSRSSAATWSLPVGCRPERYGASTG